MRRLFHSDVKVLLPNGRTRPLSVYLIPSFLLMLGGLLLIISIFLPYWSMTMFAPQYPRGLKVNVYVNQLEGDVREIDSLNHYLGMPPLDEGGQLERSVSVVAILALGLLLLGGVFVHNKWAAVLALPALLFPLIFLADLRYILWVYGHSIDPQSPLGGAIEPFTPPLFGVGLIGQFETYSQAEMGLYLAFAAVVVILIGLWFHRAAYKPAVVDAAAALAGSEA
jgi:copper chaperone NosL